MATHEFRPGLKPKVRTSRYAYTSAKRLPPKTPTKPALVEEDDQRDILKFSLATKEI